MLLFLLASGLTLIFGIMDFINLSHGSFYMIGAYFCGTVVAKSGSFLAGIIFGLAGMFAIGALVEWFIARKLYRADHLDHVLVTFGLILVFDFFDGLGGMAIVAAWWGIWHIISGLSVALFWSRRPATPTAERLRPAPGQR